MAILGTKLLISYIPYSYKDGGFFITITPDNKVRMEEIPNEPPLPISKLRYDNETPKYSILLSRYFDSLKTELDDCFKLH